MPQISILTHILLIANRLSIPDIFGRMQSVRPINSVDIDQVRFESRPDFIRYGILFVDSMILHFGIRFKKVWQ